MRCVSMLQRMRVDPDTAEVVAGWAPRMRLVLATDNTEPFAQAFERARARRAPCRAVHHMADLAPLFDEILCSAAVGTPKAEDPARFFGPWLTTHGLRFADAVLVDDRPDNCEASIRAGGAAIKWQIGDDVADLRDAFAALAAIEHDCLS